MNIIKVKNHQYKTEFNVDDKVTANGYCGVLLTRVNRIKAIIKNKHF